MEEIRIWFTGEIIQRRKKSTRLEAKLSHCHSGHQNSLTNWPVMEF